MSEIETENQSETRDLKEPKPLRVYQFERGSLEAADSLSFVALHVRLLTNRAPFPTSARAFDYISPDKADLLATALKAAARKARAYRAKRARLRAEDA